MALGKCQASKKHDPLPFLRNLCDICANLLVIMQSIYQCGAEFAYKGEPMLLRFAVSNHLSIRDRQELSLVASSLSGPEDGLIECVLSPSGSVLPTVVIYGANASGKSNLVGALETMRRMVLSSHREGKPDGGVLGRQHFRLDGACAAAPSLFEVDFVLGGVRHHYGFKATDNAFVGEWLLDYPLGRPRTLFERDRGEFRFGRGLKGRNRLIADLTRENSLFLSAAAQHGHEKLTSVFSYFLNVNGVTGQAISGRVESNFLSNGELDQRVLNFLGKADTGIVDYRLRVEELAEDERELMSKLSRLGVQTPPDRMSSIELAHRGLEDDVYLELEHESAGTRRLLVILARLFEALDTGTPLVVDELDLSLHTQASQALLGLFCARRTNRSGAQLIATVHDTNLLAAPFLRRDQVWFTEKTADGATETYPLSDIRTRKGDNLEKGYLQKRYGAAPRQLSAADFAPFQEA